MRKQTSSTTKAPEVSNAIPTDPKALKAWKANLTFGQWNALSAETRKSISEALKEAGDESRGRVAIEHAVAEDGSKILALDVSFASEAREIEKADSRNKGHVYLCNGPISFVTSEPITVGGRTFAAGKRVKGNLYLTIDPS